VFTQVVGNTGQTLGELAQGGGEHWSDSGRVCPGWWATLARLGRACTGKWATLARLRASLPRRVGNTGQTLGELAQGGGQHW
jgi:hypothetical protein